MRVQQLEQLYRDGMSRLKEQMKKQEKERLEHARKQIREEEKALYEKKLENAEEARNREMRLIQEELNRITDQAVALKEQIDTYLSESEK